MAKLSRKSLKLIKLQFPRALFDISSFLPFYPTSLDPEARRLKKKKFLRDGQKEGTAFPDNTIIPKLVLQTKEGGDLENIEFPQLV